MRFYTVPGRWQSPAYKGMLPNRAGRYKAAGNKGVIEGLQNDG